MVVEIDFNVEIWMLFINIILIYVVLMLVCFGWLWMMKKFSNCFLKKKLMEFGLWIIWEILIVFFVGVCGVIILVGVFFILLFLLDGNVFLVCYELVFLVVGVIFFCCLLVWWCCLFCYNILKLWIICNNWKRNVLCEW